MWLNAVKKPEKWRLVNAFCEIKIKRELIRLNAVRQLNNWMLNNVFCGMKHNNF